MDNMKLSPGIKTKRHSVLRLFESVSDGVPRPKEWVECQYNSKLSINNLKLPPKSCHVVVKRWDGNEVTCAFWDDRHPFLSKHGFITSHFQDLKTDEFLHEITRWKYLDMHTEEPKECCENRNV